MARSNKTASTTAPAAAAAPADAAPAPVTITVPPAVVRAAPRDGEERNKMLAAAGIAALIGFAIGS